MNYITKKEKFKHLTKKDRIKIESYYNIKMKPLEIAKQIGCSKSCIYDELKRGYYERLNTDYTYTRSYSADIAQNNYNYLATSKGVPLKIGNDFKLVAFIEDKILKGWSPDVIIGHIKEKNLPYTRICTSTLYSYIEKGVFLNISNKNLLIRSKPKRPYNKVRLHKINLKGTSIENRSAVINERIEKGHWEMDTVIGTRDGKSTSLLVLSERVTRQEIIIKIKQKTQKCVCAALDKLEKKYGRKFKDIFKTITVDNGTENLDFQSIEKSIYKTVKKRTQVFYCHPYSSWERGTNENSNRLIRRFIPKGTDISKYTDKQIKYIENWINNYPRKILGYLSSNELFTQYLQNLSA